MVGDTLNLQPVPAIPAVHPIADAQLAPTLLERLNYIISLGANTSSSLLNQGANYIWQNPIFSATSTMSSATMLAWLHDGDHNIPPSYSGYTDFLFNLTATIGMVTVGVQSSQWATDIINHFRTTYGNNDDNARTISELLSPPFRTSVVAASMVGAALLELDLNPQNTSDNPLVPLNVAGSAILGLWASQHLVNAFSVIIRGANIAADLVYNSEASSQIGRVLRSGLETAQNRFNAHTATAPNDIEMQDLFGPDQNIANRSPSPNAESRPRSQSIDAERIRGGSNTQIEQI